MPSHFSDASNPLAADLDGALARATPIFEELRGQRLVITGGTGFFGCWLLETLVWANRRLGLGARATVLTREPARFVAKAPHLATAEGVTLLAGAIRDVAFPRAGADLMIHAATSASAALNAAAPLEMVDTIVEGTRRALAWAEQAGVRRVLFTSSGAVYGPQPSELAAISEDHRGGPDVSDRKSAYAEGKRMAELLCAIAADRLGIPITIARGFAFVGPYLPLDLHFAIGNFIRDGLRGGPIVVKGDGSPYRSYLYGADLAVWLWTILLAGKGGRPYNVGSDQAIQVSEIARLVARCFEREIPIVVEQPRLGQVAERYVPATARARAELGLRMTVTLEVAIRKTIAWHAGRAASGEGG